MCKKALSMYGVEWVHPELPSDTVQGYVEYIGIMNC